MKQYKDEMECLIKSDDISVVVHAMLDFTFNCEDSDWAERTCIKLLSNKDEQVSGLAATCLGHLARIHGKINKSIVMPALAEAMKNEKILGSVENALDDIKMFAK